MRVIAGEPERLVVDHARACVDGVGARATLSEGTVGKYLEWGTWEGPVASEVMRVDLAGSGRYEVYYYDLETGVIIRIVGPGETRCWLDRFWQESNTTRLSPFPGPAEHTPDWQRYELLTQNSLSSFQSIQQTVEQKYGRAPLRIVNRKTACQPDGSRITEEGNIDQHPKKSGEHQESFH